jgi:hypothetical protein
VSVAGKIATKQGLDQQTTSITRSRDAFCARHTSPQYLLPRFICQLHMLTVGPSVRIVSIYGVKLFLDKDWFIRFYFLGYIPMSVQIISVELDPLL